MYRSYLGKNIHTRGPQYCCCVRQHVKLTYTLRSIFILILNRRWKKIKNNNKKASGSGDGVFDVNLPSTLSLEVEASGGSNFTAHGLASAEAFFMQVADGGLTFVDGTECV